MHPTPATWKNNIQSLNEENENLYGHTKKYTLQRVKIHGEVLHLKAISEPKEREPPRCVKETNFETKEKYPHMLFKVSTSINTNLKREKKDKVMFSLHIHAI